VPSAPETAAADLWTIEPRQSGIAERARELWAYRHLWWFFAGRTLQRLYRRSSLGMLWLVLRISGPVGLNSLIFGGVLDVKSGSIPYFLFFLCGSATWILFDRSLLTITRSVEQNRKLVTRVYFPRIILPFAAVSPAFLYLAIVLLTMVGTNIYFYVNDHVWYIQPGPRLLVSAAAIVMSLTFAIAVGLWTSVLQARYRDVRMGLRQLMPFWFYLTPVIYPLDHIPEKWRWLAALNPMSAVVEAFKWGTLREGHLDVAHVGTSVVLITLTMVLGIWFFNRQEGASVDKLG
jgi:lipopolysaccharide transport system permease protein